MADKESAADRVKREEAEKAEQAKLDAEKAALAEAAAKADAEEAALAEKQAAIDGVGEEGDDAADEQYSPASADEKEAAAKKLRLITADFPLSTPDEHVVFGRAGMKFTIGELRTLFDLQRS